MNPLRIEAKNIGAIPYRDLDLSGIQLCCVHGPNGRGKSTMLTIAPLFALFGGTKNGCSVDDMIRTGETEMYTGLEFEHRGEVYRVTRSRSRKTKAGKSTLELFKKYGDEWENVGGTSIAETQAKIRDLLGLDAETFTSSSLILQNKANEFTGKPPAQRKAILQQILGLEIYDQLQERAKKKHAARTAELEQMKGRLAELEKQAMDMVREGILQGAIVDAQTAITQHEADIETTEGQIKDMEARAAQIQATRTRLADIQSQIKTLQQEIQERQQLIDKESETINRANKLLENAVQIRLKAREYDEIREQMAGLETNRTSARTMETDITTLKTRARDDRGKAQRVSAQVETLQQELAQREQLEQDAQACGEAEAQLEKCRELATEYLDKDRAALHAQTTYDMAKDNATAKIGELQKEIQELGKKISILSNSGCIDPENAQCRFVKDAQEAKRLLPGKEEELRVYKEESLARIKDLKTAIDDAIKARDSLGYNSSTQSALEYKVRDLRPSVTKLAALESKAELLKNFEAQRSEYLKSVEEAEKQIAEKTPALESLQQEIANMGAQEARLPKLKQWSDLLPALANAEAVIKSADERKSTLQAEIDSRQTKLESMNLDELTLQNEIAATETQDGELDALRGKVQTLRAEIKDLQTEAGRLQGEIERIGKARDAMKSLRSEMEPIATEIVRWQTLCRAFGKDGVPAMIIENAVPELEQIANEILGQMTRGQNSLFFNTQREKKDGKGLIETLDIMITDWDTPQGRPYETFSGGEQLRIDFALRFALAELLARRAGSRVEWLTIDEGLGSQDAEHRTLVLEAIKNVASRFKKVLVITHIEEAQATFDECINF